MHHLRALLAAGSVIVAAAAASTPAQAAYADIVFFGDSLSDTGNLYAMSPLLLGTQAPTSPPYDNGRLSNGPLWSEHFANGMGKPGAAAPAVAGGNNYAVAGTTLGNYGVPFGTIPQQLNSYLSNPGTTVSSNNLYVILGGGNDIRAGLGSYQKALGDAYSAAYGQVYAATGNAAQATAAGNAAAAAAAPTATSTASSMVSAAVDILTGLVKSLFDLGARHFLIGNVPDIGHTPETAKVGGGPLGTALSQSFNAKLDSQLPSLVGLGGMDLKFLDLAALERKVLDDPAAYGFTNVTDGCKPGALGEGIPAGETLCDSPDTYYYFDNLHPSARGHRLIGAAALQAIPEPATLGLISLALAALALGLSRRRRAAPSNCFG